MFKLLFDFITELFGSITGNWLIDLFIVAIISQVLYPIAFYKVGQFKRATGINDGCFLSFLHWSIRGVFFIIVASILSVIYKIYIIIDGCF